MKVDTFEVSTLGFFELGSSGYFDGMELVEI